MNNNDTDSLNVMNTQTWNKVKARSTKLKEPIIALKKLSTTFVHATYNHPMHRKHKECACAKIMLLEESQEGNTIIKAR